MLTSRSVKFQPGSRAIRIGWAPLRTCTLAPEGTEFQHRVWHTLRAIPFGTTISYMELARRIGEPAAIRAVGSANGRNPIPVIIPCHRVIGSDGSMIGFGGGIELKKRLLQMEQMALPFRLEAES